MNALPDKNHDPLQKIISNDLLEQPSLKFTDSVMNRLGLATATSIKYEPVISSRGWIFISSLFLLLCWLGWYTPGSAETMPGLGDLGESIRYGTTIFENIFSGAFVLLLTSMGLAVLLLFAADAYYRSRRIHTT